MYFLNPAYQVKPISRNRTALFSEDKNYFIQDECSVSLIQLLSKSTYCSAPFDELKNKFHNFDSILTSLLEKGIIIKDDEDTKNSLLCSSLWYSLNIPLDHVKNRLTQTISLVSFTEFSIEGLKESLKSVGLQTEDNSHFHIVVVNDYLDTRLKAFNEKMIQESTPWMLLKPLGKQICVGPIFGYHKTFPHVTWEILSTRLKENNHSKIDIFGFDNEMLSHPNQIEIPTNTQLAYSIAANETLNWIITEKSPLFESIFSYNNLTFETSFHHFSPSLKYLYPIQELKSPIELQSSKKTFVNENGERSCSPEITHESVISFMSPMTGFISKSSYRKENNLHIYFGPRSLPFFNKEATFIPPRSPDVVVGKSNSRIGAQVAFIAEAIERYFSTDTGLYQKHIFSYEEIAEEAVHPSSLLNFSQKQYEQRQQLNATSGPFQWIPFPFEEKEKINWIKLAPLNSSTPKFFPSTYCYINTPPNKEFLMCPGDSNGCATGNTFEEALFYGLLEIIERDAMAIWWYNRLNRPLVDFHLFHSSLIEETYLNLKKIGRLFSIIDISTELEIPVFVAISWKEDGSRIILGSGAHLDPQLSLQRAVLEHNQVLRGADFPETMNLLQIIPSEREFIKWVITEKIDSHSFLRPKMDKLKRKENYTNKNSEDFYTDIQTCLHAFDRSGLKAYWLPLTPPEFPLKAVKVIVPEMRHFWRRMGKGRLYDVPVMMSDFQTPVSEEEMNPISYFA